VSVVFELNFFVIKKWLGHLLMPLPFSLSLLVLALVLLWFTRFQKAAGCWRPSPW
jgi:hypothetical protein